MNLKRLQYFCTLADIGNYTRAAEKIGIAQPALSISIKKLEEELGHTLINRAEKTTILTSEGKVLYRSAKNLLNQANNIEVELQELKNLTKGEIRFGVSAMMGSYYFPQVLTAFKKDYPTIKIVLIDQGTTALERMLVKGELDLALVRTDQNNVLLNYQPLIEEEVVAGMPKRHPLTSKRTLSLAEFCEQPLVLFHEGYYLRDAVGKYAKKNNLNLDIRMETNLIELQKALVKSQVGITSCLSMILDEDDDLISIPFNPKINLKLGLAWKQNQRLSKATKVLVEYLQNQQT